MGLGEEGLGELVGFHAQQAVEKALKAVCVARRVPFRKTHDLGELLETIEAFAPAFASEWQHLDALTDYAVAARYPLAVPVFRLSVAEALTAAERLVEAVEGRLGAAADDEPPPDPPSGC